MEGVEWSKSTEMEFNSLHAEDCSRADLDKAMTGQSKAEIAWKEKALKWWGKQQQSDTDQNPKVLVMTDEFMKEFQFRRHTSGILVHRIPGEESTIDYTPEGARSIRKRISELEAVGSQSPIQGSAYGGRRITIEEDGEWSRETSTAIANPDRVEGILDNVTRTRDQVRSESATAGPASPRQMPGKDGEDINLRRPRDGIEDTNSRAGLVNHLARRTLANGTNTPPTHMLTISEDSSREARAARQEGARRVLLADYEADSLGTIENPEISVEDEVIVVERRACLCARKDSRLINMLAKTSDKK
ncbi:hypothetical protein GQ44DRAFT_777202 [Phaeosphaeriaceae sp. PMI808]|nr:hypothetical protein GQ44DRAFT_777202 [Phaeosphaeriaceae sp. PMI808]